MTLREITGLVGNDLWKAINAVRKPENLDWLEEHFRDETIRGFIRERREQIRARLPLSARITLNIDAIVAHATGCTPWEANQALNKLQEMARRRREEVKEVGAE